MSDIRKRPYRLHLDYIPQELKEKKATCPNCQRMIEIPWLSKNLYPKQPIPSKDNKGHWIPVSINIKCSNQKCKKSFFYPIERRPIDGTRNFYGDESERIIKSKDSKYLNRDISFFCISLIGCNVSKQEKLNQSINEIKKRILPIENPENWALHFKEVWNSKKFSLTKQEKIYYAEELANLIKNTQPDLAIFNYSGVWELSKDMKKNKKILKQQKEYIYTQALVCSLDESRLHNLKINWFFDHKKDSTMKGRTEGWANEIFLGLQYTNLFTWYSAGATILEPNFVKPGSHFLLEIADFCSFWIARGFLHSVKKTQSELSTDKLGLIMAQANDSYGNANRLDLGRNGQTLEDLYGLQR